MTAKSFNLGLCAILSFAAFLYIGLIPHFRTGIYNDDAVYVVVARDLENTHASKLLPLIKPDYPLPGLPIVLAPLARFIHTHWDNLDWAPILATLLTVWLLAKWSLQWLAPGEALLVAALYAFNPTVVKFSGIVMPESFYSLAAVAGFFLMDAILENPSTARCLGLGLVLGWATVIRAEGGVLLVSIMTGLFIARGRKRAALLALIPVLAWLAFDIYWFKFRHLNHSDYAGDLSALRSYWFKNFLSGLEFSGTFLHYVFVKTLMGVNVKKPIFLFSGIVTVLALTGMGAGFLSAWRQKEKRAELAGVGLFCGLYLVIHLFWHVAISRYCIALLPFVWIFLVRGFRDRFPALARRVLTPLIIFVPLFISYAHGNGNAVLELMAGENPVNAPPWNTLNWLEDNTPLSAKAMSPFAPSIVLYTNRAAVPMINVNDAEIFRYRLHREAIDYIVDRPMRFVTPGVGKTENLNDQWTKMRRWIGENAPWFQLEFRDTRENTSVYRVVRDSNYVRAFELYFTSVRDFRRGDPERALAVIKQSLLLNPDFGIASNLLGAIYFERREYSNAERAFLKAAALQPDSPTPLINLSTLYGHEGQTDRAMDAANRAADRIDPNSRSKKHIDSLRQFQDNVEQRKEVLVI